MATTTKRILLFLVFALLLQPAMAQPARELDEAQWHKLTNEKAFGYKNDREGERPPPQGESGFQKAMMAFWQFLGGPAGTFLIWMVVIAVVIYVLYRLAYVKGAFLFGRRGKSLGAALPGGDDDDVASTNWETLLQQAAAQRDVRMEVRYRYMWLLQLLQRAELIQYRNDKTNYDYYSELSETNYKQSFRQLSRLYEFAWYGNYELPQAAYKDYVQQFDNLKNKLPV